MPQRFDELFSNRKIKYDTSKTSGIRATKKKQPCKIKGNGRVSEHV